MDEEFVRNAKQIVEKLDIPGKKKTIREMESLSFKPDFWQDHKHATSVMKKISSVTKEIEEGEMLELLFKEGKEEELKKEIHRLEYSLYLSGPYDRGDAILSLHAGQGGTEAMDWTAMLLRMYTRYIEKKGWESNQYYSVPLDGLIRSDTNVRVI